MKYAIILILILILLIIKSEQSKRTNIKKQRIYLKSNWGKHPDREYTSEQFENIKYYYNNTIKSGHEIDNITWNDLNMDEIFMMINNTRSAVGEEHLYKTLRDIKFDNKELKEIDRLATYFNANETDRINTQMILREMGKPSYISISEYIDKTKELKPHNSLPNKIMGISFLISVILIFIKPEIGIILSVIMLGNNILFYYKRKAQIENYFTCFVYILRMLDAIKGLNKLKISEISMYTDRLDKLSKHFTKFKKNTWLLIAGKGMKGSLEDMIIDYFRMLFHIDLIKFDSMLLIVQKNEKVLQEIMNYIGFIDSTIAIASFREQLTTYSVPELINNKAPNIEVQELFHPLLEKPVTNSFKQNRSILITGSNASGKSTFLKSVAINAILSQTIYTSISSYYKANYFKIYSSMSLKDNIFENESYYIVEIKSLKRILDRQGTDIPILCFVDEVLRGTNTIERIAASSEILRSFALTNTICFAATHDIELTYILENYYENYHFQEKVIDKDIHFDYKLYEKRANSKNAIKLLQVMGYSEDIINRANDAAKKFININKWETFS